MTRKHSARTLLLASACVASLGLIAGVSPAAAKKRAKTRTVAVTQTATASTCLNANSPVASENSLQGLGSPAAAIAGIEIPVPAFRGLPQDGAVTGVSGVGVRITHTFDRDLSVLLVAPGSRMVPLALSRGLAGDGYGTGAKDCSGNLVQFGDGFSTPISMTSNTGNNPIDGSFRPELPLNTLVGTPARGTWNLIVTDGAGSDDGFLNAFRLSITYSYVTEVKVKPKKKKR